MSISVPIKLELSQEEKQTLEVKLEEKKQILSNLLEKSEEEKQLLSLIDAILRFFKKTSESLDKTRFLKNVLLEYKNAEEKIDWNKYLPTPPVILRTADETQNSVEISLLQQELQNFKFKKTNHTERKTQIPEQPELIKQLKEAVQEKKLKPVKPEDLVTSSYGVEMSEQLAKILAKQRIKINEENTENTDSVVNEESLSEEVINIAFHERRVNILSTILEESENQRNSFFFTPIIETSTTNSEASDSDNNDSDLREFEEMEKQIALETLLKKKLEEAEKQLEEALIGIESVNSISETITPVSFYNLSSTDIDKPIIVDAIRKPSCN